jgi:hypothetical protein
MSFINRDSALETVKKSFHKTNIAPYDPSDYLKDLVQLLLISETGKSQLKSIQKYIKTHGIFIDLRDIPEIESFAHLAVVASFDLDTISVKFHFCPLLEAHHYYHFYYKLVTRDDIGLEDKDKIFPEKNHNKNFGHICTSLWGSGFSAVGMYERYPDVFDALYKEYFDDELRFLSRRNGTPAYKEDISVILNKNITIIGGDFLTPMKFDVVGLIPCDELLGLDLDSLEADHSFDWKCFQSHPNLYDTYKKWVSTQQDGFKFSDFLNTLVV